MTNKDRLAAIAELSGLVGTPFFYNRLAQYDPQNAREWNQMAMTQMVFAQGEDAYNVETRRYSHLMRLTLHRGIVEVFKDQDMLDALQGHSWNPDTLFTWFLKAHVTAFRANGWMDKGVSQRAVMSNTRIRDYFNGNILMMSSLANVAVSYVRPDVYMTRAAMMSGCRLDAPAK